MCVCSACQFRTFNSHKHIARRSGICCSFAVAAAVVVLLFRVRVSVCLSWARTVGRTRPELLRLSICTRGDELENALHQIYNVNT